ncbi:MAG: hypothetical protein ACR2L8_02770 [Solirubrobacteraceae bacterium]
MKPGPARLDHTLAVDNAAFHLFDLDSGEVLASPVAGDEALTDHVIAAD